MGLLKDGLAALGHVARQRSLAPAVYAAEDAGVGCPSLMAAIMLQNRDNEVATLAVLSQRISKQITMDYGIASTAFVDQRCCVVQSSAEEAIRSKSRLMCSVFLRAIAQHAGALKHLHTY